MHINWDIVLKITVPLVTLFFGIILNKWAEDKPRLITYLSHTFAISSETPYGQTINVHTHSIVVRNVGRKSSTNVRLGHTVLPAFQIYPSVEYTVKDLPDRSKEIIIPSLVPKEQITVNYLYFPPLLWNQVNTYTKSDQGFAKAVSMILSPQYSKKVLGLARIIFILGLISLGYLLVILIEMIMRIL
jgi:hypothetical protein